jgi:hypothetical protein
MPIFPYKLHGLLDDVEENEELSAIISWLPDGKSFRLHSPSLFEKKLLRKYFPRQNQLKSFMRQLQYYGFDNFGDGLFSHPRFLKGQRNLCGQIIHQLPTKNQKRTGKSTRPLKPCGRKKKNKSDSTNPPDITSSPPNSGIPPPPNSPEHEQLVEAAAAAALVDPPSFKEVRANALDYWYRRRNLSAPELPQSALPANVSNSQLRFAQSLSQQELRAAHAHRNNLSLREEFLFGSMIRLTPRPLPHLLGMPAFPLSSAPANPLLINFFSSPQYSNSILMPSSSAVSNRMTASIPLPTTNGRAATMFQIPSESTLTSSTPPESRSSLDGQDESSNSEKKK